MLEFDPKGERLAVAYVDGAVGLWDVESGKQLVLAPSGAKEAYRVTWSPDGSLLVSVGREGDEPRGYNLELHKQRAADMPKPIVAVMGPGEHATPDAINMAIELGRLLAEDRWVILTGGRNAGDMRAVNDGAKEVAGSLTVGVLPSAAAEVAPSVDVAIVTGMNSARNNINVLSSRVVIAFGQGGPGTVSEVALALKAGKPVILLAADEIDRAFFERLGNGSVQFVESAADAVAAARCYRHP